MTESDNQGGGAAVCRSIKTLRNEPRLSSEDIEAAALQYVRKVSGYHRPSQANKPAFDTAVAEIAHATHKLLGGLVTRKTA